MSDVLITGIGCVSPHGKGAESLWRGLVDGRSALKSLTLFDASMFRNPLAGVVDGYATDAQKPTRAMQMLIDACDEALRDSLGLKPDAPHSEIAEAMKASESLHHAAIITGTNFGGMSAAETALVGGRTDSSRGSLDNYLFGAAGNTLAQRYGTVGPRINLSLSCASGTAAIGLALDSIRCGRADVAIACGYDELSLYIYAGLSALRAITPETIRPFDRRRKGTLFSEGAGVVVLESAAHAARRNAPKKYARVLGRAMNNDAFHMTAPEEGAHGIQALMRAALNDAKVALEKVDHLNLHATGTPLNDAIETKAVHGVFGARGKEIPVCSVKSSIGHCMGAAGIIEAAAAVFSLRDQMVPPVLGLDPAEKDPACELNTTSGAPLKTRLDTILKTSYGFGGTNAAVVLAKI